jgi:hypothetical protein
MHSSFCCYKLLKAIFYLLRTIKWYRKMFCYEDNLEWWRLFIAKWVRWSWNKVHMCYWTWGPYIRNICNNKTIYFKSNRLYIRQSVNLDWTVIYFRIFRGEHEPAIRLETDITANIWKHSVGCGLDFGSTILWKIDPKRLYTGGRVGVGL